MNGEEDGMGAERTYILDEKRSYRAGESTGKH